MNNFIKPVFTEIGHRYDSSLGRYTSATTRIHSLEPKEDWDKIAQAYIDKRSFSEIILDLMTKQSKTREQILAMINDREINVKTMQSIWKTYSEEACDKGSKEHAKREASDLGTQMHEIRSGEYLSVGINPKPIIDYYNDLPDGVYPELLLWHNKSMTSGTADRVIIETIEGVRWVTIEDYKTNKKIVDYNYLDKRTGMPVINKYMLAPFADLCNCNYWHYQIQLNIYGYMLEAFGFKIRGGSIIHTEDNDKIYKLLNLQKQVTKAFNMWTI